MIPIWRIRAEKKYEEIGLPYSQKLFTHEQHNSFFKSEETKKIFNIFTKYNIQCEEWHQASTHISVLNKDVSLILLEGHKLLKDIAELATFRTTINSSFDDEDLKKYNTSEEKIFITSFVLNWFKASPDCFSLLTFSQKLKETKSVPDLKELLNKQNIEIEDDKDEFDAFFLKNEHFLHLLLQCQFEIKRTTIEIVYNNERTLLKFSHVKESRFKFKFKFHKTTFLSDHDKEIFPIFAYFLQTKTLAKQPPEQLWFPHWY